MTKLKDVAKNAKNHPAPKLRDAGRSKTVHAGGTAEFDEATGKYLTPAERLLRKNFKWANK